jgi:uncharacterized Zn finger protein
MIPKNIKALQRESKGLRVQPIDPRTLVVSSASNPDHRYVVSVRFGREGEVRAACTCPWAAYNGIGCSHVMAALEHMAALKRRKLSFWGSQEEAARQKQRVFQLHGGVWITSRAG